jgi:maltose alpha-D-glucosyltransferase/alpha-amylase
VEAQLKDSGSLLNFVRRIIKCRKQHRAFGRGACEFLNCANPAVLAHLRRYNGEDVLVLHNLSASSQNATLDLHGFTGVIPVDILTKQAFSPVLEQMYALTLMPYQYLWLLLNRMRP